MPLSLKRSNPYSTPKPCVKGLKLSNDMGNMRRLTISTTKKLSSSNTDVLSSAAKSKVLHDIENMDPQLMFETPRNAPKRLYSALDGLVVEVEGNIASGKSTLTKAIEKMLNARPCDQDRTGVFAEHVNNSFLAAFYSDTKRFSFAFQMYMLTTRLYQVDEASRQAKQEGRFVLLDRGAVGDAVFATLNHELGNMDDLELDIYKSVCQQRTPNLSAKVDLLLYLDVDPSECYRRVHEQRQNKEEEGIPLSYLDGVDKTYFHVMVQWIANREKDSQFSGLNVGSAPPLCVIPWTSFGTTHDALEKLDDLAKGRRRSPSITFSEQMPDTKMEDVLLISTAEEVDEAYSCLSDPESGILSQQVHMNWDLPHDRPFRRTVMAFLGQCMDITFYQASS